MNVQRDCLDALRIIAQESFEILAKFYNGECIVEDLVSSLENIKHYSIEEYNNNSKILNWYNKDYDLLKELKDEL